MRSLTHSGERGRHFQGHPLHATFSLIASMLLAGLLVLRLSRIYQLYGQESHNGQYWR